MEWETEDCVLRCLPRKTRAACILAGGALCMASLSVVYSFGNLLPYLASYLHLRVDASITAGSMIWLQTLLSGVPFSMLVGGVAEQSLGGRSAAFIGCALYTVSIAFSSVFVQWSFSWLLLSFGVLPSFGSGIAYNAVLITAQRWFPHRLGLASGVIIAGFGCGTFFVAPLQTAYVNPERHGVNAEGYFTDPQLLDRVPGVFLAMAALFGCLQVVGLLLLGAPAESVLLEEEEALLNSEERMPEQSLREMLCSSSFATLFLTLLCSGVWVQISTGFYKAYGLQFIPSDFFLSLVASISSIFNCGSRVCWGFVADRTSYQLAMCISSMAGATVVLCLPLARYTGSPILFLFSICLVFCSVGGTYTLLPFASSRVFGQSRFGVMYGLVQLSLPLSGVLAGFLAQFALPFLGYDRLFLIAGCLPVFSFILTALFHLTPLAKQCVERRTSAESPQ